MKIVLNLLHIVKHVSQAYIYGMEDASKVVLKDIIVRMDFVLFVNILAFYARIAKIIALHATINIIYIKVLRWVAVSKNVLKIITKIQIHKNANYAFSLA